MREIKLENQQGSTCACQEILF